MDNIIIHIPHSSLHIPRKYKKSFLLSKNELNKENLIMCDYKIDKLIKHKNTIKFKYSRLLCDVERFLYNDIMDSVGMGVYYTKTHDLKSLRVDLSADILEYYHEHHKKLNNLTANLLNQYDDVLFIDLHSYSNEILPYELNKLSNRPDFCIGINKFHYNKEITDRLISLIKKYDYTYQINEPFSGCLIPSHYYLKNNKVYGIMIEINKNTYNTKIGVKNIKKLLKDFLN